MSIEGYFLLSGFLKVRSPISMKSSLGQVSSEVMILSGQDSVYRIGRRMSGQPSWASTEESAVSTMEWMMD